MTFILIQARSKAIEVRADRNAGHLPPGPGSNSVGARIR